MAKTKNPPLPTFEDHDVNVAEVRITKCGDGLSEALKVEPKALQLGDEVTYVLTGVVSQISHKEKDGIVTRLHTIDTTAIAAIEPDLAGKLIQEEALRITKIKDAAEGQTNIDDEMAAQAREAADAEAAPTDIAKAAAKRVKDGGR